MPIFMDRHDIPGLTAMDVAEGHKQDLEIQHQYGCRALTYWYDEKRGLAFCLIEAPEKRAVEELHEHSHGLIPNHIIEVKSNLVEAFLGRIEDPESSATTDDSDLAIVEEPAFRAIMVTELQDAALMTARLGQADFDYFSTHNNFIQAAFKQHNGREIRRSRAGFLGSFDSVSNCMACAIDIQKRCEAHNNQTSGASVRVAIGLSAGFPVTDNNSLFGETIQLARRLCYIANQGQVVASSTVKEHYVPKTPEISSDDEIRTLNPMEEKFLNQLMDIVERVWNQEGFDVDDFSRQMGLSRSQLYRKITSLTHLSPNEFVREFRLRKAIELIEMQHNNISQIAFETGFGSPSYFSKCFQERFGILPSDYARAID